MLSQLLSYILPLFFFLLPVPLLSATSPDAAERYKAFPVCKKQCSPAYVLNWEEDSCLKITSFLSPPRKVVWRSIKELAGILSPLLQCFIHRLSNKDGKEHTDSWPSLFSSFPARLKFVCPDRNTPKARVSCLQLSSTWRSLHLPPCVPFEVSRWYFPGRIIQTLIFGKLLRKKGKRFHSMDWLMEKNGCWNDYNSSFHKDDIKDFNIQHWFPDFLWNLRFQVL